MNVAYYVRVCVRACVCVCVCWAVGEWCWWGGDGASRDPVPDIELE